MVDREEFYKSYKGHKHGWYLCRAGTKLARLDYQGHTDMFWLSFRVVPLTAEAEDLGALWSMLSSGDPEVYYENCKLDLIVPESDFLTSPPGDGTIGIRDCRPDRAQPTFRERLHFFMNRIFRQFRAT